jgi:ketosteroid isomerase-like protein
MSTEKESGPIGTIHRLHKAMNEHDLDAFVGCFDPDYQSEQPAHPDRAFFGAVQVRKNWSAIFASVPDFEAGLLGLAADGDTVWSEWSWSGKRTDGTAFNMRGVIVFGMRNDRIKSGRLYMEPMDEKGAGIDASVRDLTKRS